MELRLRKFIRWVLAGHVVLLAILVLVVFFAAREVYHDARSQAVVQATTSQELLAEQTAEGIETLYDSIRDDLDLLGQADREAAATQPATGPAATQPHPLNAAMAALANALRGQVNSTAATILWRQLESRVSLLFVVNTDELDKYRTAAELEVAARGTNPPLRQIGPPGSNQAAAQVADAMREWLKENVHEPSISPFVQPRVAGQKPYNLVCFPAGEFALRKVPPPVPKPGGRIAERLGAAGGNPNQQQRIAERIQAGGRQVAGRRLIVAVVDVDDIQRFLAKLNRNDRINASLADDQMVTMVSSDPKLVGVNAAEAEDEHVRDLARRALAGDAAVTVAIEEPYRFGSVLRHPRLFTMQPVDALGRGNNRGPSSQLRWWLMVSSPLSDVDEVVNGLFRRALWWAVFVVISMTGLLVSTSVWLIRGRVRVERLQHEMLTRELDQARQIQLAWLPSQNITSPAVDVAAVNTPANHISGDFYNWFDLPDGRIVVTIGDVTGHGMSAAFLMATTQLLVRGTMMRLGEPGLCMEEVNRQLCSQVFNGQFVTMLIAVLDLKEHELRLATAGHYPPLVSDGPEGAFRSLPMEPQLVLGVDPESGYPTETYDLVPGGSLLLYTDGVLDVEGARGERFRAAGLQRTLAAGRFASAQAMLDAVVAAIDQFRGPTELPDDLTLVAVQLAPAGVPQESVSAAL